MNKYVAAYAGTAIVMVALDMLWLGVIAKPMYQQGIGHLMAEKPNVGVAVVFYLLYALGPHTASLGLARSEGGKLPAAFADGMFIGQHGSWNRRPHSGYKVIFVPFDNGKPSGDPVDVLAGFLSDDGNAFGRPVGVALDKQGALLVADDVGTVVWRVSTQR